MVLKGKCKITLKNAETGMVEHQEEHTNTITPALTKIFEHNMSGTVDYTKLTPLYSKLLGGICCWNGTVNSSDVYLPKQENATLTAHAGQETYSGSDHTRGSVNNNTGMSGAITNGYKWVWDFSQAQGNGHIDSLSLVHADVGDNYNQLHSGTLGFCPIEDISNYVLDADDFIYDMYSPNPITLPQKVGISDENMIPLGFYGDLNHVVSVDLTETDQVEREAGGDWRVGKMTVYISKFTGTGLHIWNDLGDIEIERQFDVDLSGTWQWANFEGTGRGRYYVAYDEPIKHLYVICGGDVDDPASSGGRNIKYWYADRMLKYYDINLETGVRSEMKFITMSTSAPFVMQFVRNSYDVMQLQVVNGCIFLPIYHCDPDNIHIWDRTSEFGVRLDLRNCVEKDYLDGSMQPSSGNYFDVTAHVDLGNDRTMFPTSVIEKRAVKEQIELPKTASTTVNEDSWYYCDHVDRDTGLFGTNQPAHRTFFAASANELIQYAVGVFSGTNRIRGAVLNKMYCASVFALSDGGINKSSTQTMTIEYTIYQEEEET